MSLDTAKHAIDTGAIGVMLASLFDFLPHATALLSFIWICIRLYETKTVQGWLGRAVSMVEDE